MGGGAIISDSLNRLITAPVLNGHLEVAAGRLRVNTNMIGQLYYGQVCRSPGKFYLPFSFKQLAQLVANNDMHSYYGIVGIFPRLNFHS